MPQINVVTESPETIEKRADNIRRMEALAADVMDMGRTEALLALRFLDRGLYKLRPHRTYLGGFTTDGELLNYRPEYLLKEYSKDSTFAIRVWLHPLMHCLFLHNFIDGDVDRAMWDLSCDMAAEAMIADLHIDKLNTLEQRIRTEELKSFQEKIAPFTAEMIYKYLMNTKMDNVVFEKYQKLFELDDHDLWYDYEDDGEFSSRRQQASKGNTGKNGKDKSNTPPEISKEEWKKLAKQVKTDLETFSKDQGHVAGNFVRALSELEREPVDYSKFLKKFATMTEVVKNSPDEFDYIMYTFGLNNYQDMPFIEPLEYREDHRIKELCVIIDTSGSVQGKLVQTFLQKTFNILKQQETFDRRFNLHIIQADAEVQRDDVVHTQKEFDELMKGYAIHGAGGTDFRPALRYVEELRKNGSFQNLAGVLYFTDGLGTYPERMPDFKTAFVFVENDAVRYVKVPAWAIRVTIREDEIYTM